MRALLAEMVNIIAEQHESEKELIIHAEALSLVVTAMLMRLDDTVRVQLKHDINEAFAAEHSGNSSHTAEKCMLQGAVEKLFTFQTCHHQDK